MPDQAKASPSQEAVKAEATKEQAVLQQLAEMEEIQAQLKEDVLRARADCDNLYKRMQRELLRMQNQGIRAFAYDLCDVLDLVQVARANLPTSPTTSSNQELLAGIDLLQKELLRIFTKHGITNLDVVNKEFDPNTCEAVAAVPSDQVEAGFVIKETRKGYLLHDTLLRAARVVVAAAKQAD